MSWLQEIESELYELGLNENQVRKVLEWLLERCNTCRSNAHWKDWDFGD